MDAETFLILPHPDVMQYMTRKTGDIDRWLRGMRRLRDKTRRGPGAARMSKSVDLWLDLKSPYSFLAKDPAYALERELGVTLAPAPYALDILGALQRERSQVAERGLRRIKYLYADVRRFANQRGIDHPGTAEDLRSDTHPSCLDVRRRQRQGQGADRSPPIRASSSASSTTRIAPPSKRS